MWQDIRTSIKIWIAELSLHFGWAILGQKCDCGYNPFNWIAHHVSPGKYGENGDPLPLWTSIKYAIGNKIIFLHNFIKKGIKE